MRSVEKCSGHHLFLKNMAMNFPKELSDLQRSILPHMGLNSVIHILGEKTPSKRYARPILWWLSLNIKLFMCKY